MPTTNPVPSQDPSDLLFNAGKLDEVVNGTANSFTDRLGATRRTVAGMNADFDAQLADAESDLNVYRADAAASAAEALGYLQTIRATSYGAYASDPATDPLGNPPTVGDEYFNTTSNLLKRWNGTTWQASDINTANLAAPSGSSLVGYDGGTVQDVLDAVTGPNGAASVGYTPAGTGAVATTVQIKLRESVSVKDFGAVGDGVTNDTAAIQAASDYCALSNQLLHIDPLTYKCTSAIHFACDVNGDGATFQYPQNYNGIGIICASVSDINVIPGRIFRKRFILPEVLSIKTGSGWTSVSGSVGVLCVNVMECEINVPRVENFEKGFVIIGKGSDCNYNKITLVRIFQNKVGVSLIADGSVSRGSCNQNNIYGGRLALDSSEGNRVSETILVHIYATGSNVASVNNNVFYNPSVEGSTDEYAMKFETGAGGVVSYNLIMAPRLEDGGVGGKKILFTGDNCYTNTVMMGYGAGGTAAFAETFGAAANSMFGGLSNIVQNIGPRPVFAAKATSSNGYACFAAFSLSATVEQMADTNNALVRVSATGVGVKSAAGTIERWAVSNSNGRHEWSNGVSAADTNLYRGGSAMLKTDGKIAALGGIGVGNSAAATEVIGKAVVRKIQVFDENGSSIGFIPVYSSIG